jgi:hypothetical protein
MCWWDSNIQMSTQQRMDTQSYIFIQHINGLFAFQVDKQCRPSRHVSIKLSGITEMFDQKNRW